MKRQMLAGLAVVPLLLLGATLWARKAAWERLEETYRRDLVAGAVRYSGVPGVTIILSHRRGAVETTNTLGAWDREELSAVASSIHLTRRVSDEGRTDDGYSLQFVGPPYVFIVSLDQDRGKFIRAGTRLGDELRTLALSPESCRMLKRRVWESYGDKLRALHIALLQ